CDRDDNGPCAGVRVPPRRQTRRAKWHHGYFHSPACRDSVRRCTADELPSAPLDASHACERIRGPRIYFECLRGSDPRAISLLQLRRLRADPVASRVATTPGWCILAQMDSAQPKGELVIRTIAMP